jgi:hypothetical protein
VGGAAILEGYPPDHRDLIGDHFMLEPFGKKPYSQAEFKENHIRRSSIAEETVSLKEPESCDRQFQFK